MNTDNNAYAKFYEGIERANLAIQGIRKYGNIENNKDMAQLLGEALTLRAVIYNDLIKAWGDVPARFEPNNADNMYLPRTNRDVIYKQLLADLEEAEGYCYWANENNITKTTERVSKDFVKALRARLALYAGGRPCSREDVPDCQGGVRGSHCSRQQQAGKLQGELHQALSGQRDSWW